MITKPCHGSKHSSIGIFRASSRPPIGLNSHERCSRRQWPAWGERRLGDGAARAEQGVVPADGRRMLAFEQALPGPGDPAVSTADSCDLYQLVDLTPYADLIAQGGCMLRLTAKVRDASGPRDVQSLFVGRLSVFDKPLADILPAWPETRSLPAGSRFAIVQIDATTMDRTPGRGAATARPRIEAGSWPCGHSLKQGELYDRWNFDRAHNDTGATPIGGMQNNLLSQQLLPARHFAPRPPHVSAGRRHIAGPPAAAVARATGFRFGGFAIRTQAHDRDLVSLRHHQRDLVSGPEADRD
jgi:hypothetical protein